jgi:hypothetical protein
MIEQPLVNGRAYDWASIKVQMLGLSLIGIVAVMYEDTQEKVNNPGAGIFAASRGYGKYEAKATITLEMKEVERIQGALKPGQRLQDIGPFTVVIAYRNESNRLITHKVRGCEFTNNKRQIKAGDTSVEVELELIVADIIW